MAIDLGRAKSASTGKYEAFVAAQLARAEARIRLLDLTASLLGFFALALGCIVGMVVCDSQLQLSQHARQLALYAFLIGGGVYLFFAVLRPLRMRVNPYYAARQVEQQLPGAKNSIINWVDLRQQTLPPAIRGALGQRAAKELSHVDLERAISGRRAAWMGGWAGLCGLAFVVAFFLLGPAPFFSLLRRAFNPFGQVGVSTRTQLTLIEPAGGDAVITVGRGVRFVVEVSGKVPDVRAVDAVKLLYRYQEGEPWLERPMQPEAGREWTATLSALEVQNGLWYRITGGDAATQEHIIRVRAAPAVTDFLATYRYRPYLARADRVQRDRPLKELRGTEVLLRIRTNRRLRDGRMELESKSGSQNLRGIVAENDPQTMVVHFVLEEDAKYRLYFTSADSEAYSDSTAYPVTVIPDDPPKVELTKPGRNIQLPADALLHLEGKAEDDLGVKTLLLRMRIVGGPTLRGQPYRADDKLRLADGGYPRRVEYKDFVELSRVKSEDGRPFELRAGMEMDYWLEAGDAHDFPRPNISQSKHYRVKILEPEKNDKKKQQEKKRSEQEKKQHEDKQDQKLQQENQDRRQERKEQEARNQEEQDRNKEEQKDKEAKKQEDKGKGGQEGAEKQQDKGKGGQGGAEKQQDKGQGGQGGGDGSKDQPKNGEKSEQSGGQGDDSSKEQQDIEKKIQDALKRKEQGKGGQGESKPEKGEKGDGKNSEGKGSGDPSGEKTPGDKQSANPDRKGSAPGDKGQTKGRDPKSQPGGSEKGTGQPDKASGRPQPSGGNGADKKTEPKEKQATNQPKDGPKDKPNGNGSTNETKPTGEKKNGAKTEDKKDGSTPKSGDPSAQDGAKPPSGKSNGENKTPDGEKRDAASEEQARKDAEKILDDLNKDLQSKDPKRREEAQRRIEQAKKHIDDLMKDLKSGDGQRREDAKRQLERMQQLARDAKGREQFEKMLEQFKKSDSAKGKSPQPDGPKPEKTPDKGAGSKDGTSPKPQTGDKQRQGGDPKDADKEGGKGDPTGKAPSPNGKGKAPQNSEAGNTPGAGGKRRGDTPATADDSSSPPSKPSKPRDHHAAQMQLEDFLKKVDKNILKDAGVSEEAWRKYVQSRRKQLSSPERARPDKQSAPGQAKQLPSIGGKTIQPPSSAGNNDVRNPDRGQPPARYRDPFRKFNREISEIRNPKSEIRKKSE